MCLYDETIVGYGLFKGFVDNEKNSRISTALLFKVSFVFYKGWANKQILGLHVTQNDVSGIGFDC